MFQTGNNTIEENRLYFNSPVNDLNEWSVRKVGWFKHDGGGYFYHKAHLLHAMSGETHSGEEPLYCLTL